MTSTPATGTPHAPGTVPTPVGQRLLDSAASFDFVQAAWLIERYLSGGVRVGDRGPVADEGIRFRPDVALGFPASDVRRLAQVRTTGDRSTFLMEVTFLGLYGVSTPMPLSYAVDVLKSVDQHAAAVLESHGRSVQPTEAIPATAKAGGGLYDGSSPVRGFLDVLHHRLISLFYRACLKYRYELTFGLTGRDTISDYLLSLVGYSSQAESAQLGVPPVSLIRYAGVLTQRPRSAATLEGSISDYWDGLPVTVRQCEGRWILLGQRDQNRLGVQNSTLGFDLTVGDRVFDLGGSFTLAVGPVDWETYLTFLPDGSRFAQTRALIQRYLVDPLAFAIAAKLRAGEVPEMRLTSDDAAGRLGYTSWLRTDEVGATEVSFAAAA